MVDIANNEWILEFKKNGQNFVQIFKTNNVKIFSQNEALLMRNCEKHQFML